jgi:hypothetical protein
MGHPARRFVTLLTPQTTTSFDASWLAEGLVLRLWLLLAWL